MKKASLLKLSGYSSLALSFIALAPDAKGQVFNTDVEPDYIFTETDSPPQYGALSVDFNADASPEMIFAFSSFEFTGDCYRAGSMSFYFANYASVQVYNDASSVQRVQIINEGEEIGAAGVWDNYFLQSLMFSDFFSETCIPNPGTPFINGNWTNADNKYIGVRFLDASSNLHYGWVRLSVIINPTPGDAELTLLQIDKFAFESQSGVSIIAGDEGEPLVNIASMDEVDIQITPNPVSDYLHIALTGMQSGEIKIQIADIRSSQVVLTEITGSDQAILNVAELPQGVYLLLIEAEGKLLHGRFVKM